MPDSPPLTDDLQERIARRNREQVRAGERFAFGRNWERFLRGLTEADIAAAEASLTAELERDDVRGLRFLDAGSGSGLFSLSAMRMGAAHVHSFDFDPECVACAQELKRRYFPNDDRWTIECGDILSADYLNLLTPCDVVYSWGVLHQTGEMWQALDNVARLVATGGVLFISIYNHQPWLSPFWRTVKRTYNRLPRWARWPLVGGYLAAKVPWFAVRDTLSGRAPWYSLTGRRERGMSLYHDAVDWIGGYPFETAEPEAVIEFCGNRRLQLVKQTSVKHGSGCNQFVFRNPG